MRNIKSRVLIFLLSVVTIIGLFPATSAMAAEHYQYGGWDMVETTCEVININGGHVGTVYAGDGVTALDYVEINGQTYVYLEYSGSSGAKRGYVPVYNLLNWGGSVDTGIGKINTSCTSYYSPKKVNTAGSVSKGEYVAVLCDNDTWAYIEYNVANGQRKRAFIQSKYVDVISDNTPSGNLYHNKNGTAHTVKSKTIVYAGPNMDTYPDIGYVTSDDNGRMYRYMEFDDCKGHTMYYIRYETTSGEYKYGYVRKP